MTFAFTRSDRTVAAALRRIATVQIDSALAALDDDSEPLAARVHAARKAVKKTRGLIRLVRPVFPAYAPANAALRTAAHAIGPLRESAVLLALFDDLASDCSLSPEDAAPLRTPLEDAAEALSCDAMLAQTVATFRHRMQTIRDGIDDWCLTADGFDALSPGLVRTLSDARSAMKAAGKAIADCPPDPETLHDWRKRIKDHWYQARLLSPLWPEAMAPRIATADTLAELLGDHHDLSGLSRCLDRAAPSPVRSALRAEITRRRTGIEDQVLPQGRRLLADSPPALAETWRIWWKLWRG